MSREINSLGRIASALRNRENQVLLSGLIEDCGKVPFTWQMDSPKHYNGWRSPESLEYWSRAMEMEVNSLLNISARMPAVKAGIPANPFFLLAGAGMYDTRKKQISIHSINSAYAAIEALAHEICHYVQNLKEYNWVSDSPIYDSALCEGFADAIAIASIGNYAEKSGNLMLKCNALKSAQKHMEACRDYCADRMPSIKTDNHVGATAFLLAEARHGKGVYEKVLKSCDPAGTLVRLLRGG
ncbi:MAG: hypothetical protein QME12_04355 [Nanoarchaeota archaeon]|nr:hypothetical protein [Nanoarchaeota archaeon]